MKKDSVKNILCTAYANKYAVPAINVSNMETITAVLSAADAMDSSVILQVAPLQKDVHGFEYSLIVKIIDEIANGFEKGVYSIHLDHATSFEDCSEAFNGGFDSLMFDGASLDFEGNINGTKKVRDMNENITLEGELGVVGGGEADAYSNVEKIYTEPSLVSEYINKTGVDILAVSIGNAHGAYKGKPHLELEILEKINSVAGIPLVLHGASGIPYNMIKEAVKRGISKINFFTEIDGVFKAAFIESCNEGKYMMFGCKNAQDKVKEKVIEIIKVCKGLE